MSSSFSAGRHIAAGARQGFSVAGIIPQKEKAELVWRAMEIADYFFARLEES